MKCKTISAFTLVLAFLAMTAFSGNHKNAEPVDDVLYYWFDVYDNYLWRYQSAADEMFATGFNTNPSAPSTIQEKGFTAATVSHNPPNAPVPDTPSNPDILLYSHP